MPRRRRVDPDLLQPPTPREIAVRASLAARRETKPGHDLHPTASRPRSFVAYFRVSTQAQGRSGLGLEAQQASVAAFIAGPGGGGRVVAEFTEVESGKRNSRPELAQALAMARAHHATLIVAKLDRLARNAHFLLSVVEGTGDAGVVFCDLPTIPPGPVGKFFITLLASVAELEAGLTSQRTKAALAAAKARGVKLGNPRPRGPTPGMEKAAAAARIAKARRRAGDVAPVIDQIRSAGATTLTAIAAELRRMEVPTPSGRGSWHPVTVARVIAARAPRPHGGRVVGA
jgi:DNA invertase Pin-like site-specific DNA recombinase